MARETGGGGYGPGGKSGMEDALGAMPITPRLRESCRDRGARADATEVRRVGAADIGSRIELGAARGWGCGAANELDRSGWRGGSPAPVGSGWTLARVLLG